MYCINLKEFSVFFYYFFYRHLVFCTSLHGVLGLTEMSIKLMDNELPVLFLLFHRCISYSELMF